MLILKKATTWLSILAILLMHMATAQAAIVTNAEVLSDSKRTQLVNLLERQEVQQQLIEHGVDPKTSLARVDQMTDEEITQLNGNIDKLTAGAGVSTVELLLIIILVILIL
ncbi:MAG: PA2779 family protein [Gammaproteobacteria bacterium]|nr:PA2779 family protein [Gammaproteobacteria bacterium]